MGYEAKKTEHAGPKKGNGAYWGPKRDAKKESNRIRRRNGEIEIQEALRSELIAGARANAARDRAMSAEWLPLEEEAAEIMEEETFERQQP
jgi:hypothetical protein